MLMLSGKNSIYRSLLTPVVFVLLFTTVNGQKDEHQRNLSFIKQQKTAFNSIVLLNNEQGTIPVKDLEQKIASVNVNVATARRFDSLLNKYTVVTSFSLPEKNSDSSINSLNDDLKFYNTVIVQINAADLHDRNILNLIYDIPLE